MRLRRSTTATMSSLALVIGLGAVAQPASAAATPTSPHDQPSLNPDRTVTLITGDSITVSEDGRSVRPRPGPGRKQIKFLIQREDSRLLVIPIDALPLLAEDQLDRRLFDVTGLLAAGYSDSGSDAIPLIVIDQQVTPMAAAPAAPGLEVTQRLSSVMGVAAWVRKSKAASFWPTLTNQSERLRPLSASGKIWLDGVRTPSLDRSVPQTKAPTAWQAGWTGKDVTVAVLDSGIDTNHPDLAGKVVETASFIKNGTSGDLAGHGTHVASTIAGTGAASNGRYRGMAPDAKLLSGQVCDRAGCSESAIIAGMQWAADKGARVVNLSLGGPDDPDIDPVEAAVNRITEQTGTLFVIAAGNTGQCSIQDRVGSPASAAAALAVGAVDASDALASFSCRGPRIGDGAIKPDITAPGVGIVAARAKGSPDGNVDPVDDSYARLSGTSMASPHVAGAAAILAQVHPDWRAEQLKTVLMASAKPNPNNTAFHQGAGRVDVAQAITQTLTTSPASVSLAGQLWPHADDTPVTSTVTYRNAGSAPLALTLALNMTAPDGKPAPDGMFRLNTDRVEVPAGGTATVEVTADTSVAGPEGDYAGRLVASGGGETVLSTPVGITREVESYNLKLRHIDRAGGTPSVVQGVFIGDFEYQFRAKYSARNGTTTIRLPRGDYALTAVVVTGDPADNQLSLLGVPKVELNRDVDLTLDARTAKPIDVRPPRTSARLADGLVSVDMRTNNFSASFGVYVQGDYQGMFTGNVGEAGDRARLVSMVEGDWLEPGTQSPYIYHLTWVSQGRVFDGLVRRPSPEDLATVEMDYVGPPDRAVNTMSAAVPTGQFVRFFDSQHQFKLPARITEYFQPDGVDWVTQVQRGRPADGGDLVYEAVQSIAEHSYQPGHTYHEQWGVGVFGPTLPRDVVYQNYGLFRAMMPLFGHSGSGRYGAVSTTSARTTLYQDGVKVADRQSTQLSYNKAPLTATSYQLDSEMTQQVYDTSTKVSASWRFRSEDVAGRSVVAMPIMVVEFAPAVDANTRVPGGAPFQLPVLVRHQLGTVPAEVVSLGVEVSYDDGVTWTDAPLERSGEGWVAALDHPETGFVSLRAKATGSNGNSVQQTIIRAYGLK